MVHYWKQFSNSPWAILFLMIAGMAFIFGNDSFVNAALAFLGASALNVAFNLAFKKAEKKSGEQ